MVALQCCIGFYCTAKWISYMYCIHAFSVSCSVMSDSSGCFGLLSDRLFCPWDFPGKNTGVGCYFLLQGIFLTQGLNFHLLCLLLCRWIFFTCWATGAALYVYIYIYSLPFRFLTLLSESWISKWPQGAVGITLDLGLIIHFWRWDIACQVSSWCCFQHRTC